MFIQFTDRSVSPEAVPVVVTGAIVFTGRI